MPIIPYTPQQQLARRVIAARKRLRLSQTDLAKVVGTSQTAVARLESAQGNPTLGLIQRVVTALELHLILTITPQKPEGITPAWLTEDHSA